VKGRVLKSKKKSARKVLSSVANGALRLVNNPKIRAASKLSHQVLNTIYRVKDGKPLSVVAAGLSLLHSVAESFELPKMDGIDAYVSQHKLETCDGLLSKLIYTSGANLPRKNVVETENMTLIEFQTSETDRFYVQKQKNVSSVSLGGDGRAASIESEFFVNHGFDFENLFEILWREFKTGIYLKRNRHTYEFGVESLPDRPTVFFGEHDPVAFYDRLRRFLDAGISRSFLFNGPRGGGKSSFAMKIAREHFTRIIRLEPTLVNSLESGDLQLFLEQLKPEVLLFDDIDRVYGGVNGLLNTLEDIKELFPNMVIFATSNDAETKIDEAILRPGRFDEILEFGPPNEYYRRQIVQHYLERYKVRLDQNTIECIIRETDGLTPAFLKEIVIRSKVLRSDEVVKMLEKLNFYVREKEEEIDGDKEEKDRDENEAI